MAVTTTSKALGTRCWSTLRFLDRCCHCTRYDTCTYPERVANQKYDDLRQEARKLKEDSDRIYREIKDI
jgi:hypothetical protein